MPHASVRVGIGTLCLAAVLAVSAGQAAAQSRTVTGKVTDAESKEALPSVTVIIKGTLRGTSTKENGTYSITVPAGATTLTFRRIGYKATDHAIDASQTTGDVALDRDVLRLEESIVTGQATVVSRQSAANAVATVNAKEISSAGPDDRAGAAGQGRRRGHPGQFGRTGRRYAGAPPRYSTVIGAADPLYVVDGVIISNAAMASGTNSITKASSSQGLSSNEDNASNRLADLDPNDIETIEVLKGASASAIYGSKASNGVVLITTKRGHAGRPELKVGQRFGTSEISHELGSRMFPDSASRSAAVRPDGAQVLHARRHVQPRRGTGGAQAALVPEHGEPGWRDRATQYYASGVVEHDGGIIHNTFFDKQALNLNLHQTLGRSKLDFGLNSTFSHTDDARGLTNNDNTTTSFYTALPATPSFVNLQRSAAGTYPNNPFAPSNPLQTAALLTNGEAVNRFIGSGTGTAHLIATQRTA